jgi:fibrillarin-like pre-rRNA processing protein
MTIKPSKIFEVYEDNRKLYTINLTPGKTFFTEKTKNKYREWDPNRSKVAAAILKGCRNIFIRKGNIILYLGAAHGYTPSYISDIIGNDGFIFAIDNAPRVVRDLVFLAKERKNISPILADANHPEQYKDSVTKVDIVYQDISQKNQVDIFLKNIDSFLKPGGYALIAVKARSIDITKKPKVIFNQTRIHLEEKLTVIDYKSLEPFEKDHCFIICKK